MDPDMALSSSSGMDITMISEKYSHSDMNGLNCSIALSHQHGLRWLQPLVVTWAMDFNIDPGYSPTRGVDMALDVAWVQISPWPKVVVQATQTSMAPVAA